MISAIRGTHDILPGEVGKWQFVERIARSLCDRYGYVEVRTPVIEKEELFAKGSGESTDIVQKEMYAFTDKGGERITLRPEATPSMVRAYVEHSLEHALPFAKIFSMGPMFRYERPQKGRQRQFHQIDLEVLGAPEPGADIEVISVAADILERLGILDRCVLKLNSLGDPESRAIYRKVLVDYYSAHTARLSQDSRDRLQRNPLRILDSKD